jgi:hypothetical protein
LKLKVFGHLTLAKRPLLHGAEAALTNSLNALVHEQGDQNDDGDWDAEEQQQE